MLDRKLIISRHVAKRFEERGIKFYKNEESIIKQIKYDLNPLNIRLIKKLNDTEYRVITKQGKCYVTTNVDEDKAVVKTVYQLNKKEVRKEKIHEI